MSKTQIIRLRSKDALERVEVPFTLTLQQFRERVSERTKVPAAEQQFALDDKFTRILADPSMTLQQYGLKHGDMLHFRYRTERDLPPSGAAAAKDRVAWSLTSYMKHLEELGLVFQPQKEAYCRDVTVDFDAANQFQTYVQSFAFQRQRIGYLYGKYTDTGGVVVEAIYEPGQENFSDHFKIHEDQKETGRIDAIARMLGMERVGWIFSHAKRPYLFAAEEVMLAAKLQLEAMQNNPEHGHAFVTLKLTVNEEGKSQLESFQVSDQAVRLHVKDMFAPADPAAPQFCRTKQKVMMHTKAGGREDRDRIETDVLLSAVPLTPAKTSRFVAAFPIEHRPEAPVTTELFKRYLQTTKTKTWLQQLSDFHFVVFLSNILDARTDMPVLCEAVRTGQPGGVDGFKFLIHSYAGLS
jgi:nuclear protein localization family protein 4